MKQFNRKITAITSVILMAMALVAINTDQAIAKGKSRKGAKVRAGSNVKGNMSALQNAENVRSQAERKKVAGAEGFAVDIGTSEKVKSQAKRAPATQSGDDVVTINSLTGTAVKRVRRTTKHTRQ